MDYMFLEVIGLALIVFAWVVQLMHVLNKNRQIHIHFLAAYITGVVVLIASHREQGLNFSAILNIVSAVFATLIYLKIRKE